MFFIYQNFFSEFFFFARNTSFLWCEKSFQKYNVLLKWVKQFTKCEKQNLDCESRFPTVKGGFWSAKTGFGVRKRFLSQAGESFLPALWAGEFFLPEIRAGIFFLRSLPAPPPIKIKWLLPKNTDVKYSGPKSEIVYARIFYNHVTHVSILHCIRNTIIVLSWTLSIIHCQYLYKELNFWGRSSKL